jgi:hypothetical protein
VRIVSLVVAAGVVAWSAPAEAAPGATAATAAKPRSGKRVRVERPLFADPNKPRFCVPRNSGDEVTCIGATRPRAGESVVIFDGEGHPSIDAVVRTAEPSREVSCRADNVWDASYRVVRQFGGGGARSFGFTGLGFDVARATMQMQPQVAPRALRPHEMVVAGVDAESDGTLDHLVTIRACDSSVNTGNEVQCITHWRTRDGEWRILVEDVLVDCQ